MNVRTTNLSLTVIMDRDIFFSYTLQCVCKEESQQIEFGLWKIIILTNVLTFCCCGFDIDMFCICFVIIELPTWVSFFFSIEKETHLPTQVNKNKVQLCIKSTIRTFFNGQNIITKFLECNFHQPILKSPKTKWIKKKKKAAEVIPCNQSSSCACWLVYCIGVQYSTTVNTIKKKGTKEVVAEWKQRIGVNFLRGSSTFLYFCLHRRKMNSGSRKYWDATPN